MQVPLGSEHMPGWLKWKSPSPSTKEREKSLYLFVVDVDGVLFPHDDPMVIPLVSSNYDIKKILVDNGTP